MHARFVSFQEAVSAEAKTKIEAEVRSAETRKFLQTVSHEMRTPLNGILGMLDLAREATDAREVQEYIDAAALSGTTSSPSDILDLQKIEAGLIDLQARPRRPPPPAPRASGPDRRGAGRRCLWTCGTRRSPPRASGVRGRGVGVRQGLELRVEVAEAVPDLVLADPDRLRQVLLNLVSNAVKYSDKGSVELLVTARPLESDAPEAGAPAAGPAPPGALERLLLRFEVRDSGPGIAKEHQAHLFTRFYRVHPLLGGAPDPGGTGLGLAISREIVEKAGGRIGCISDTGQGSTFWFEIPVLHEGGDGEGDEEEEGEEGAAGGRSPSSASALQHASTGVAALLATGAGPRPEAGGEATPAAGSAPRSTRMVCREPSRSRRQSLSGLASDASSSGAALAAPNAGSERPERPPARPCAILVAEGAPPPPLPPPPPASSPG
eukprot:tig00000498_g1652.t1